MPNAAVLEQIRRDITQEEYRQIRDLWKAHSIAEDNRDIPGLLDTLTPNCVYELPQTGDRWEGHEGAERFYRAFLGAFPDIRFNLRHIVIGPQGVWEEAEAAGTHSGKWLRHEPSGHRIAFTVFILFPWDRARGKFRGERVHYHGADL